MAVQALAPSSWPARNARLITFASLFDYREIRGNGRLVHDDSGSWHRVARCPPCLGTGERNPPAAPDAYGQRGREGGGPGAAEAGATPAAAVADCERHPAL